jgi:putative DNA primase/helicase
MNSYSNDNQDKAGNQIREIYLDLQECFGPFTGNDGELYCTIKEGDHKESWRLDGEVIANKIRDVAFDRFQKMLDRNMLDKLLSLMAHAARKNTERYNVFRRVGKNQDAKVIDLGTPDWSSILIQDGIWKIVDLELIKFVRSRTTKSLPVPPRGGDVFLLRKYLNLEKESDFLLVVAYLVASLLESRVYPILILQGGQGCAKSTTSRVLKQLIDPGAPELRSFPSSEESLFIAARNTHLLVMDNMSGLQPWASDALCKIATGCGHSKRELYTDFDESVIEISRPIILNGIDDLASRPDLLDRSIVLHLPKITDEGRRSEQEFWADFECDRPRIFSGILDVLAGALSRRDLVDIKRKPRMADFALIGSAVAMCLDMTSDTFVDLLFENREDQARVAVEMSTVGRAVLNFAKENEKTKASPTDLHYRVGLIVPAIEFHSKHWPKDPAVFAKELKRLIPPLKLLGLDIEISRSKDRREWTLVYQVKPPTFPSQLSPTLQLDLQVTPMTEMTAQTGKGLENDPKTE